jgi:hypothetical protein
LQPSVNINVDCSRLDIDPDHITKQHIDTRQAPVDPFKKYRKTCDPKGLFYTRYLRDLLEG